MAYTTIDDPSAYFHAQLYTGNATDSTSITNDANSGNFQPDWLWIKNRSSAGGVGPHFIVDSSRGANKDFHMNNNEAEHTTTNAVKSFNSDGFTIDSGGTVNNNTDNYISWQWKANGGTETHSQSESGSNIACSVQANSTAGFSIITYTGTGGTGHTFLHGLGSAPACFITKRRSGTEDWLVYHHKNTSAPETDHLLLNSTAATDDSETRFDDTAPNSTEIACGNNAVINADGSTYVTYAFKEIQGYSKYGTYEGNNNSNGPFIYLGFKPQLFIVKNVDSTSGLETIFK